ncbi:hypothetical protein BKI51_22550 [Alphaproteobacteria bacterium AO1-B]|nr:hypothetical protein BKI51_22550 [Alphaproteobacteria bacterium AO1-B]
MLREAHLGLLAPEAFALMLMLRMLEKPQSAGSLDPQQAGPKWGERRAPLYRLAPQLANRRALAARSAVSPVRSVSGQCRAIAAALRRLLATGCPLELRQEWDFLPAPELAKSHQLAADQTLAGQRLAGQRLADLRPAFRIPALPAVVHRPLAKGSVHRSRKAGRP